MRRLLSLAVLVLGTCAAVANAGLTWTTSESFQQTSNSPCIIGNNSCTNDGFPYTVITVTGSSYTTSSPEYTVGQLAAKFGVLSFSVGIDVNSAGNSIEVLEYFRTFINNSLSDAYSYEEPTNIAVTNPGNGWSDAVLNGLSFESLQPSDEVYFTASVSNETAGLDQFFLIPREGGGGGGAEIPEPGTVILMGAGLGVLALLLRRRRSAA